MGSKIFSMIQCLIFLLIFVHFLPDSTSANYTVSFEYNDNEINPQTTEQNPAAESAHERITTTEATRFVARTTPSLPQRIFRSDQKSAGNSDAEFFHFKCQVTLDMINKIAEVAENLRQNLTMALLSVSYSQSRPNQPEVENPNESETDEDILDAQLGQLKNQLIQNERAIVEFRSLYEEKSRTLRSFRQNLGRALTRRFPSFSMPQNEENVQSSGSCGGLMSVIAYDAIYLNFTNNGEETCSWVLFNPFRYYFEIVLLSAEIPSLNQDAISIHTNFITTNDAEVRILKTSDVGKEIYVSSPAILTLAKHKTTSRRRQGFQIKILGSDRYASVKTVQLETLTLPLVTPNPLTNRVSEFDESEGENVSRKFSHPADGAKYKNDEESFFILKPRHMNKVKLSVLSVDMETGTERYFDYLNVYKFNRAKNTFEFFGRHTGLSVSGDWRYEGEQNEPILLYFHSDSVGTRTGFTISFTNQRA